MSESKIYPVPAEFAAQANINSAQYEEMYQQSVEDPEGFWSEQAENYLSWFKPWNSVCDWSFG
jgi:acetyl-CoA synthetase